MSKSDGVSALERSERLVMGFLFLAALIGGGAVFGAVQSMYRVFVSGEGLVHYRLERQLPKLQPVVVVAPGCCCGPAQTITP